jgi:hypothetical protein
VSEGKQRTYFKIAELSYKSPARLFGTHALPKQSDASSAIIQSFGHVVSMLAGFDADMLEDIRELAKPVGKAVASVRLVFNDHAYGSARPQGVDQLPEVVLAKYASRSSSVRECEVFLTNSLWPCLKGCNGPLNCHGAR